MARILIVEDEELIRTALRRLLERNNYEAFEAGSVAEAIDNRSLDDFDLIITDIRLPGALGTELIDYAANTPVLLMTSYASVSSAVDAMKRGAVDYITKPFDHDLMLERVETALAEHQKQQDQASPSNSPQNQVHLDSAKPMESHQPELPINSSLDNAATCISVNGIVGQSPRMLELYERIKKVAPTEATVLILGESGTGKELVARAVHEQSRRGAGPLISVNCAAIPETLIESELFGHEKGAFTGANTARKGLVEAADGGTLFLDEIGELPLEAQARLLRLLQDKVVRPVGSTESRKIDVRLVAATHRDLKSLAARQLFRDDLYYRLKVVELKLVPLRERGQDILELAQVFLRIAAVKNHRQVEGFTQDALDALLHYPWPGNVREMENAIERAVILGGEEVLVDAGLLGLEGDASEDVFNSEQETSLAGNAANNAVDEPQEDLSLDDYFVRQVLSLEGQMTETALAKKLGISRKNLWERRNRLGIPRKKAGNKS